MYNFSFYFENSLDLDSAEKDPKELFNYMPHAQEQVTMIYY